jgi:hypothetical protein
MYYVFASFSATSIAVRRKAGVLIFNMASMTATPSFVAMNFENGVLVIVGAR